MTGNILTPTAVVKANIEGKEVIAAKTGVGTVDAALNTVWDILGETNHFKLQEFAIFGATILIIGKSVYGILHRTENKLS